MNRKTTKRPRRERNEWQSLVDGFESSGQDMKAFCDNHGIRPDRLKLWQRRLKKQKFVELPSIEQHTPAEQGTWDVELSLGNNITLRLRTR